MGDQPWDGLNGETTAAMGRDEGKGDTTAGMRDKIKQPAPGRGATTASDRFRLGDHPWDERHGETTAAIGRDEGKGDTTAGMRDKIKHRHREEVQPRLAIDSRWATIPGMNDTEKQRPR